MNWSLPDKKPHVPAVLSQEAIEELRLCGLYPNAADLLATLDAVAAQRDEVSKYAVALQAALERMMGRFECFEHHAPARGQPNEHDVAAIQAARAALAKNPNLADRHTEAAARGDLRPPPVTGAPGSVGLGPDAKRGNEIGVIRQLKDALSAFAIEEEYAGDGSRQTGWHCRLCSATWGRESDGHEEGCLLAAAPGHSI